MEASNTWIKYQFNIILQRNIIMNDRQIPTQKYLLNTQDRGYSAEQNYIYS
jgi:hypothetical protein